MSVEDEPSRGRPRDPRIDDAVLAATRELLATEGFAATTIQAVARRAEVGATAIYRRWPSRIELIESAVFPHLDALDLTPAGDIVTDLRGFLKGYCALFGAPAARAAIPGVLAAYQSNPDRHRALAERIGQNVRSAFRAMLAAAGPEAVDPEADADAVLDMVVGAAFYLTFIQPFTNREDPEEHIVGLLARAVRPARLFIKERARVIPRP
jgi:AcrR family transcriptional regulator